MSLATDFLGFRAVLAVQDQLARRHVQSGVLQPDVRGIDLMAGKLSVQVKIAQPAGARNRQPYAQLTTRRHGGGVKPRSTADVFVFVSREMDKFWVVRGEVLWAYVAGRPQRARRRDHRGGPGRAEGVAMQDAWTDAWESVWPPR